MVNGAQDFPSCTRSAVVGACLKFARNYSERQEMISDCYLNLLQRGLPATIDPQTIGSWIHKVARRTCIDYVRGRMRRARRERQEPRAGMECLEHVAYCEPMADADDRLFVEYFLSQLSGRELQLAQMLAAGDSYKDMATTLGVSPVTIRTQILKYRRRWNEEYKEAWYRPPHLEARSRHQRRLRARK